MRASSLGGGACSLAHHVASHVHLFRLSELNDEHLLHIFGFLEAGDLSSACQTCKRWCHVTDDYTLWRSLCYSLRLSARRVFRFSRHSSSSSSPPSPSLPESDPAPRALSKLAFRLEKFDLEPLASNWKVLYRRLRVRPSPIFPSTLKSPQVVVVGVVALGSPSCWRPPADAVALCGPRVAPLPPSSLALLHLRRHLRSEAGRLHLRHARCVLTPRSDPPCSSLIAA